MKPTSFAFIAVAVATGLLLVVSPAARAEPRQLCHAPDAGALVPGQQPHIPHCKNLEDTRRLSDRTHSFIAPTGNTLPAGQAEFRVHELGLYNTLAIGVTDQLELAVGAPVIPIIVSASARLGLLPRSSSLRLVVEGSMTRTLIFDVENAFFGHGLATAAYQGENFNLHASVGVGKVFGTDQDQDARALATVGGLVKPNAASNIALFGEVGRIRFVNNQDDEISGMMAGMKYMGLTFDVDIGVMLSFDNASAFLPIGTVSYQF